jgi:hypothetical protein
MTKPSSPQGTTCTIPKGQRPKEGYFRRKVKVRL